MHLPAQPRVKKGVLDILGIGVGKMSIALDAVDYRLGDTVRGTLTLSLTEPIDAKRLVVGVEASQRVISTRQDTVGYRRDTVWRFEKELKGEGRFSKTLTAKLTLKLPEQLEQSGQLPDTLLGDVVQVVSFLAPTKRFPLEWSVFGFLDRPWKVNVKARVPITVSAAKRARAKPAKSPSKRGRPRL